jgi:tRNA(fMet)-specific endonuclease VapC
VKYILDTDVVSELVARTPNPRVMAWLDSLDPDDVYLSIITVGELARGIEKLADSKRKALLRRWLQDDLLVRFDGHILPLELGVIFVWAPLVARLENTGRPLPALDSFIAATALSHESALVTRNEADFAKTGVRIVNPWKT